MSEVVRLCPDEGKCVDLGASRDIPDAAGARGDCVPFGDLSVRGPGASELSLLFQLLRRSPETANRGEMRRRLNQCKNDPGRLVAAASEELLTPILAERFAAFDLVDEVGADLLGYFDAARTLGEARQAVVRAQLTELVGILVAADVVPVLLKGSAYEAVRLYPCDTPRLSHDIDILIGCEQLPTALSALHAAGYVQAEGDFRDLEEHHHFAPLVRVGQGAAVELHREPVNWSASHVLTANEVIAHAIPQRIGEHDAFVPSPTHMVLQCIIHGQIANGGFWRCEARLRDVHDLSMLIDRYDGAIDWGLILERMTKLGAAGAVRFLAELGYGLLGRSVPSTLPSTLAGRHVGRRWCRRASGGALWPDSLMPTLRIVALLRCLRDSATARAHFLQWLD